MQRAPDPDAGIEMGTAYMEGSAELPNNARTPPPPPARHNTPPPYPTIENATCSSAPAAPSRPPPPTKKAPIYPKSVPAPRPVGFNAGKPL